MKKSVLILILMCFTLTGCTGSFNLTRKVYNFHRSDPDKWIDELKFLLVALTPVYGLATFADAIVFNSIEFWTGENPVEMTKNIKAGDAEAVMAYDPHSDRISVTPTGDAHPAIQLERRAGMVRVTDDKGKLLYASTLSNRGELLVYNGDLELVKNYSPAEMEQLKNRYQP